MGIGKSTMESMVNFEKLFSGIYKNRKVLITGHTGFKGSWLSHWLHLLGAEVIGVSLESKTYPNHYQLFDFQGENYYVDIRNISKLKEIFEKEKPEIVFHLAAQSLVRYTYHHPIETYEVNVLGTLNILETCRNTDSVKAIVNVTSDKCYENKEWIYGYRENDSFGGYDPYSSSKGCVEILTNSFRNSFFNLENFQKKHHVLLASARAGNVIGGGDWAEDRLIPDIIRAASKNDSVEIRNPKATRPWQHVLEPLSGYLLLGEKLLIGDQTFAEGWNLGPELESNITVDEVLKFSKKHWNKIEANYTHKEENHEAHLLMLDCSKARKILKWKGVWNIDQTMKQTINWYRNFYENGMVDTEKNITDYINTATKQNLVWTQ